MHVQDLFAAPLWETPLADFGAFGDPTTPGTLRADDLRAIRNPKWHAKLVHAFGQTGFNFNIYLYNGAGGKTPISHEGIPFPADLKNLERFVGVYPVAAISRLIGKPVPEAQHSITVALLQNEGTDRIPLTPWMLAHRVVHALFYAGSDETHQHGRDTGIAHATSRLFATFTTLFSQVERLLDRSPVYHALTKQVWDEPGTAKLNDTARINLIGRLIGKPRSARSGNLSSPGEFIIESVVQYLLTGRVSFNRPVVDEHGRTVPSDPGIDPDLLAMARTYRRDEEMFLHTALRKKHGFAGPPRRPDPDRESYTAFNQNGQAIAAFGPDRLAKYQDQGYRIERQPPPTRQAITRYETYRKRRAELQQLFATWQKAGLLHEPAPTATDQLDQVLDRSEQQSNGLIEALLDRCVGKAFVL